MAKSKRNFTHQVIFSENHHIVVTTPKGWARENKNYFSDYSFDGKNVPRTKKIEEQLDKLNFTKAVTEEMVIYFEFKK